MEHPDVIREIDALIDSYNWEIILIRADKIAPSIKHSLRMDQPLDRSFWRSPQAEFMVVHLFIQILEHPRVKHKGWILTTLSQVSGFFFRHQNNPFKIKTYQALHHIVPLLRRYMSHHKASYRLDAAVTLSQFVYHSDQMAQCLLEHARHEQSPLVILKIFSELMGMLSYKKGVLIRAETQQAVIDHAEQIIHSNHPLISMSAASLLICVLRRRTPAYIFDHILAGWPRLDKHNKSAQSLRAIGVDVILMIDLLGQQKQLKTLIALLLSTRIFDLAITVWIEIEARYFRDTDNARHIAFTVEEKTAAEALLLCKPLWMELGTRSENAHYLTRAGLEPARATLRQQIKHAQIIDETQQFSQPIARFGLTLMQN